MKILVIEDDLEISAYITKGLTQQGYTVDQADNGKDGLFLATSEHYDVLIIDRMLPGLDGLSLIKMLRAGDNNTSALILSALGEVNDKVTGLRAGGDDYLVKPFAFAELLARIEVLGKRALAQGAEKESGAPVKLAAGPLEMDLLAHKVSKSGKEIALQSREFRLLEYLLRHKGQLVTRTMLLENVWDYHFDPQTNVIDVHISRLRRKIDENKHDSLIKTIRGAGYMITDRPMDELSL